MNKVDYAWVIQRDDDTFLTRVNGMWCEDLIQARLYCCEENAEFDICKKRLQNCKPVKIEIKVVEK